MVSYIYLLCGWSCRGKWLWEVSIEKQGSMSGAFLSYHPLQIRSVFLHLYWWPVLGVLALFWHTECRKAGWCGGMDQLGEPVYSQFIAKSGLLLSFCIA